MKISYMTRDGLGGMQLAEAGVEIFTVRAEKEYDDGVTAFIPASDNVNAVHLALLSMEKTDAWREIDELVLMDNGSTRSYNWEVMKEHIIRRGEGRVIRVDRNVDHKGAMDILSQLKLVKTRFLLSLDNDIEFLKPGMITEMIELIVTKGAYCVGHVIPDRTFQSPGYRAEWPVREWFVCESVLSSCCMWRAEDWYRLILEVTAGAYWLPEQNIFYDNTSRMHERAKELSLKRLAFDFSPWVKHYGCVTWARRKPNPAFQEYNNRYLAMSIRLKELGGTGLQEDEWTGGGWVGFNIESQDFTVEETKKEESNVGPTNS